MGQASFVEAFLRPDVGANRRLERIDRIIDCASTSGTRNSPVL
jgi:hypothetical protein